MNAPVDALTVFYMVLAVTAAGFTLMAAVIYFAGKKRN